MQPKLIGNTSKMAFFVLCILQQFSFLAGNCSDIFAKMQVERCTTTNKPEFFYDANTVCQVSL